MIINSVDHVTLTSSAYKGHSAFWRKRLGNIKEPFVFVQHSKSKSDSKNSGTVTKKFCQEVIQSLDRVTAGKPLETSVTVLSALMYLLSKYNGGLGVTIKTPNLKLRKEQLKLEGSEVLIHEVFNDKATIRDLLDAVQRNVLETYRFQGYPFDALDDDMRDVSALSNVGFVSPHVHEDIQPSFYDLDAFFVLNKDNSNLSIIANYNPELFSGPFVNAFLMQLENVLLAYADLSTPLAKPLFLGPEEKRKILVDFNQTALERNNEETIVDVFVAVARKHSALTAVKFGDRFISYQQLNADANRLARHLRDELGVKKGDPVGIMMKRSGEIVVALMAVLKAGGFYVPIDPGYPQERINFIFQDTDMKALLIDSSQMFQIGAFENPVFVMDLQLSSLDESDADLDVVIAADDLAYLIYTSGSSGQPKGVMVEHRGVANLARWQANAFGVSSMSNILQFFSYSFDGAVGETFMALLNGAALMMYDQEDIADNRLVDFINQNQVHLAVLVPSVLKQMDPAEFNVGSSLTIISVGEECPLAMAEGWCNKVKFYNAYGPTEYTVYSHYFRVSEAPDMESKKVPVGMPIANTQSYILDHQQQVVPVGVPAEICLSGEGIARGYWNRPLQNIEKFVPNPFYLQQKYEDKGKLIIQSAQDEIAAFIKSAPDVLSFDTVDREYGPVSKASVLASISTLDRDIQESTELFLDSYVSDEGAYRGFCRYLLEGANRTYASCGINADVLREVLDMTKLENSRGIDLGFGNAEVMLAFERLGIKMRGMDLSPYFVQRARDRGLDVTMSKVDVNSAEFASRLASDKEQYDVAVSTLLLDRVSYPLNYLQNLFFLIKPGGQFAFQTLLPVFPVDDSDVKDPIIYTQPEHRITPGRHAEQDKQFIIRQLIRLGASNIKVRSFPGVVMSRDGVQSYTIWSFAGYKETIAPETGSARTFDTVYRTGDIGRYLPDGNIVYMGRNDELIKIRGFRVEPGEVEHRLLQYPSIQDAVVAAKYDHQKVPYLVGYVVSSEEVDKNRLIAYMKDHLPDYLIPTYVVNMEKLPVTPNGKIDKNALPNPVDVLQGKSFDAPASEIQQRIANVWKVVLGRDKVGLDDDFFSIGGHSLTATQVVTQLHRELNVKLKVADLFMNPTVRELAVSIATKAPEVFEHIPAVTRQEHYEASHAQKSLWILDQSGLSKTAFNMPGAYMIKGAIDHQSFSRAWSAVLDRHEILRTNIVSIDGEPRQVLRDAASKQFQVIFTDLRGRQNVDRHVDDLIRKEAEQPFHLAQDALVRMKLYQVEDERYVLFYVMHHIISDGSSLQILMNDFVTIYNAFRKGEQNPLEPLEIQYKDYASWINHSFKSQKGEAHRSYWTSKLGEGLSGLELPLDRPRKKIKSYRGDALTFYFDKNTTQKINDLALEYDATLYMVLTAFLNTFLYRYTGQNDIVIGSPSAGRNHAQLENQVGLYLNALAIRTVFYGGETFGELLGKVKENTLEAYQHQDYPFDKVVEDLQLQWDANRSPLFDVLLMLQNNQVAGGKEISFDGLDVTWLNKSLPISKYDLTFSFTELDEGDHAGSLRVNIEYNTDLFDRSTVVTMRDDFAGMVTVLASDPETTLSSSDLIGSIADLADDFSKPVN